MYSDMLEWRAHNPPPATMMLISDQVEELFAWDLARLQQRTLYNFFLASPSKPRFFSSLVTSAHWLWKSLLEPEIALVLQDHKCSTSDLSAMFYCKSCCFDGQSLARFRKHLSSKKHAVREAVNYANAELDPVTRTWGKNYAAKPEYATAQIAVWWDMMGCPIPEGYDARQVRPNMEAAFKQLGYSGPVSITAYGDLKQAPDHLMRGLSSTGVALNHTIHEVLYMRMSHDLDGCQWHNPPPATMMLITDRVEEFFAWDLVRRQQRQHTKYNLFLAYPYRPYKMSVLVTSAEWVWESLLAAGVRLPSLRKCSDLLRGEASSTEMFYCKVCFCDCKSLDNLRNHLSSEEHAQKEHLIYASRESNEMDQEDWRKEEALEKFRKSKRFSKAHRTGFGHLHNHLRLRNR